MQEATAEALAPEVVPETSQEEDLGALYDTLNVEEVPEGEKPTETPPDEPVEGAEEPVEALKEVIEAPSDLPKEIRDAWGNLDETTRDAIARSHRDFSRKLGEQGRMVQGIRPIFDATVRAAKELPHLADMKPEQIADQVFELAKVSAQFNADPVKALMGYIDKHGLKEQMGQALAGTPMQGGETIQRLTNHIQKLETKLQELGNPEYIRNQVTQVTTEQATVSEINEFAKSAEHWGAVEEHLPSFIALEQSMQPAGSPRDILKAAYEAAVSRFVPEASKAPEAALEAAQMDPEKTKAALKAKSVNLRSQPSGKTRTLTEEEELAAVWEANH